ncbi:MAG TPA: hypothetical protein VFE78_12745 [Gemmataceae bacterium]|nr:hypothetical protein [Gemmataceae bacterium]
MGLVVLILAFVLLVACWWVGDLEFRTKLILTGIYAASWLLLFVNPWFHLAAQAVVALVLWWATFGPATR